MAETRLFVDRKLGPGAELSLSGDPARYLGRVLRLKTGNMVSVFNGDNGEWLAEIVKLTKDRVELRVSEPREVATESPLKLHLVQGISRGERMDFVVQKATELGVKRITPVLTDYGVVRLDEKRATKRQQHWQRVAQSACEQSGRVRPPLVDAPIAINTWFGAAAGVSDSTDLVLDPRATNALDALDAPKEILCLLIGPEGGFSERELDDAKAAGFKPVALGPRILRTETAAIAALTIAQSRWGDL